MFFILNNPLITFWWNNSEDSICFDNNTIEINTGRKKMLVPFSNLIALNLSLKKKLAPLIAGAVLASLALVNILLKGASLTMVGLLSVGLLVLYFGISEYWVITTDQYQESKAVWISKNKCPSFPKTLINIMDYKVSKGLFPPMYASIDRNELGNSIANTQEIKKLSKPLLFYLLPPKQDKNMLLLKIDLSKISHSLTCVVEKEYLAISNYQLIKDALLNIEI